VTHNIWHQTPADVAWMLLLMWVMRELLSLLGWDAVAISHAARQYID
jgi:hypothetical protein